MFARFTVRDQPLDTNSIALDHFICFQKFNDPLRVFPDIPFVRLNGKFSFNRIPDKGSFLVQVSYLGYKYLNKTIDFGIIKTIVFELQPSLIEANEVVVTGTVTGADSKKNSTSVGVLSHDEMLDRPSTNIIDALTRH